jgi:gliding motility-associated-like protein
VGIIQFSFSQRAKDGDLVIGAPNTIVNTYTHLTANATAGALSIQVNNNAMTGGVFGGNLAPGDLIMIIQMQGCDINNDVAFSPAYSVPNGYTWSGDWFEHIEAWGSPNDPNVNWGGYNNAGRFEQVEVLSVAGGNTINLQCALKNNYDFSFTTDFGGTNEGHVQIVRVPRFNNLTVGAAVSIVPQLWNGQTGGVVAIEVEQVLDVDGSINATASGFRGGQVDAFGQAGDPLNTTGVTFFGSDNAIEGSEKGEGIYGYYTEYDAIWARFGTAAAANGGGGGGYQNAGGGGGSNIYTGANPYTGNGIPDPAYNAAWNLDLSHPPYPSGSPLPAPGFTALTGTVSPGGGRGGYSLADVAPPLPIPNPLVVGPRNSSWVGDARKTNGGRGGHPLTYDAGRIFFGGGGGAGDQDSGQGGSGGRGGGLVYITNYGSITGSGSIEANGAAGGNSGPAQGNDGAGGGGAGGWVHLENATALPATIQLNAIGGNGGNMVHTTFNLVPDEADGPGGSGAGGAIAYTSGAPVENVTAGANGVVISDHATQLMANFPPNGATNGHSGVASLSAPYYDLDSNGATICAGNTANISVTLLGTLPVGAAVNDITWYTQQFSGPSGANIGTGLSVTTPVLATTTSYWVGLCPGTFRVEVIVTVAPAPNLVITDPPAICLPGTADLTAAAVTAGSDAGTLTYWTDAAATIPLATPAVVGVGTYYIQLDVSGCTVVMPVNVTSSLGPNLVITDPTGVCAPSTVDITLAAVTAGSDPGTLTYWTDAGATIPLATPTAVGTGTYYIQLDVGGCTTVAAVNVTVTPAPALIITDPAAVCSPSTVDITLPAVTVGSDAGALTYWTDAGATVPFATPTIAGAGTYYIQLDVSGCTVVQPVTVTVNPLPSLIITNPAAVCAPATVDITVAAVTAGSDAGTLTYWTDAGATVPFATPTTAGTGTYYIQLVDGNGCSVVQPVTVSASASPNLVITDPAGICAPGTVDVTAAAVTAGSDAGTLTYWTDAGATIPFATPTTAGTGTYYIQLDVAGCTTVGAVNVTVSPTPTLIVTNPAAACAPGTVDITLPAVTAGSDAGTLTYWTDAGATIPFATPTTAGAGTYYIQLDVSGCTVVQSVTVTVNPLPTLTITDPAAVCAPGTADLTAAAVTAGSDPGTLTYWTDAGATISFGTPTLAGAGTYYIQLVDGNGCAVVQSVTVTVNPLEDASFTLTATCTGATAVVTGTAGGFAFNPLPGDGATINPVSGTVSNGTLGNTYFVEYTTTGPCPVSSIQSVVAATDLAYVATITDENCGAGDGVIDLVASGGDGGPYQYSITGGAPYTTPLGNFTGLSAAAYSISILDNSGCEITAIESVSSTGGPTIDNITFTDPTCAGDCDGTITVTVSGGTPPYAYQWYDNLSNPIGLDNMTITGLCAGDYSVEVTDAGGGGPAVFFTEDFGLDATCANQNQNANGVVTVNGAWTVTTLAAEGGQANLWFVSATEAGMGAGVCGDGCLGTPALDNQTLHVGSIGVGLCPTGDCGAAYNAGGTGETHKRVESPTIDCSGQSTITLDFNYMHFGEAGLDEASLWYFDGVIWTALQNPMPQTTCCGGGCGTLFAQGQWAAAPFSVVLPASADNNPNVRIGFQWDNDANNSGADPSFACDDIQMTTAVAAGCPVVANATLTDPAAVNLVITDPAAVCAPGTVDITLPAVTAGSDAGTLTYWTDALATVPFATPTTAGTGTYYIQLDVGGCTSVQPVNVVVNPPPNLVITDPAAVCSPGTIDLTAAAVTVGSDPGTLTYWQDAGATIPEATPATVGTGTYYIQIQDGNGCMSIAAVNTVVNPLPNLVVTDPVAVCAPGTVDLTAAAVTAGSDPGTLTYWQDAGATIPEATPGAVGTGTYYIQIQDVNGCTSIAAVNATVTASPNLVITDPAAVCSPGTIDLTAAAVTVGSDPGALTYWQDAGATIVEGTPGAVGNGTYYIQLDIGGGCTSIGAVNATVNPLPNVVITDPVAVCAPGTVDLTAAAVTAGSDPGTITYWQDAGATVPEATPAAVGTGTYYIQIQDGNGCASVAAVNVTVDPLPNLVITDPAAVCAPGTVDLTAAAVTAGSDAGTLTYWTDAGATIVLGTPNAVSATGTYYIQLDNGTCTIVQPVNVVVNPLPNLVITDPAAVCAPGTIDLTAAAVTAGSDAGTLTYWTDAGATIALGTPNAVGTGTYYIQLDNGTCTSVQAVNVTIDPLPNLVITDPSAVCAPGTVDLTAAAVTAGSDAGTLTYWTDAGATSALGTPNSVAATGTYYIQLDNGTCTSVQAVNVSVTAAPNLVVTDPTAVCAPGTVDLTAAAVTAGSDPGTLTYWTDAGATIAMATPATAGTGTYYIQLDVGGCSSIGAVNALVNASPNLVITDPAGICSPATIDLTVAAVTAGSDPGTLTYWTDAGATIALGTPGAVGTGMYYIQLEDGNTCTSVQAVNAVVNAIPNVTATNSGPICSGSSFTLNETAGDATSWMWVTSGGAVITTNTDQSPTVSGAVDGEMFTVTVMDGNGCVNTDITAVSVIPQPVIDVQADVTVCGGYTLPAITGTNLTGAEAYYDGPQISGGAVISNLTLAGTQTVWVYDGNGSCSDEFSFVVTVNPLPTINSLTGSSSYCEGDAVADIMVGVVGTPNWTVNYTLDGVAQTATGSTSPMSLGNTAGTYVLVDITDANCSNTLSGSQVIIINPYPIEPIAGTDETYCSTDIFSDMTASGTGGTFTWYSDVALTDVLGTGSTLTPTNTEGTTTYYVTESTNGCEGPASMVVITVENCEVIIPTAFTPDGDLANDFWEILYLDSNYPDNIVRIFNRWGSLIYEHQSSASNPYSSNMWDGTYQGAPLPVGSYYFIIDFNDGGADPEKGTVSIILNK